MYCQENFFLAIGSKAASSNWLYCGKVADEAVEATEIFQKPKISIGFNGIKDDFILVMETKPYIDHNRF